MVVHDCIIPVTGDMILRQPDNIVHEIISHLNITDLVRTSVLSKQWRYLWLTTSPNLIFDVAFYMPIELLLFAEQSLGIRSRSSSSCCLSLENLVLHGVKISSQREITSLDNCIRYAVASDLKRFNLRVYAFPPAELESPRYVLPPTLFSHRGLVELILFGCMLKSSSFSYNTSLPCMKLLHVWSATVDSVKLVEDLIASCPLLEDLTLSACFGCKGLLKIDGIVNNPKLIKAKIQEYSFDRVEIDAPALQSLTFGQHICTCNIVMSSCKNIRQLQLSNVGKVSAFSNNSFSDLSLRFLHLEEMVLRTCSMQTIKISCSSLKRIQIYCCDKLVKVEIDDPNLSSFDYMGENMIYFASNALGLSVNITLFTIPSNPEIIWFTEFVEFLKRFNTAKALTLDTIYPENAIIPRELRASLHPPLYNVERLVLEIMRESLIQTIDEIIDGALWLSPHPGILSFTSDEVKILELTFLYDDEIDGDGGKHCSCFSSVITCWRHCLKQVKIKNLGMPEEVEKKIKFFFERALSLRESEDLLD